MRKLIIIAIFISMVVAKHHKIAVVKVIKHQTPPPVEYHYSPPVEHYGPPAETYGLPAETYGPPAETYGPPAETYGPPAETYGPPAETYGPPAETYWPPVKYDYPVEHKTVVYKVVSPKKSLIWKTLLGLKLDLIRHKLSSKQSHKKSYHHKW